MATEEEDLTAINLSLLSNGDWLMAFETKEIESNWQWGGNGEVKAFFFKLCGCSTVQFFITEVEEWVM